MENEPIKIGSSHSRLAGNTNIEFYTYYQPVLGDWCLDAVFKTSNAVFAAKKIEFKKSDCFECYSEPLVTLNNIEMQSIMNSLWSAGIRPINGECSTGQIGAIKDHLNDIRKLVSRFSKAKL